MSAPPPPPPPADPAPPATVACHECGRVLPAAEVARYGTMAVCGACKPRFDQKLREGVPPTPAAGPPAPPWEEAPPAVPGFWQVLLFLPAFWIGSVVLTVPFELVLHAVSRGQPDAYAGLRVWLGGCVNLQVFAVLLILGALWARRPLGDTFPFRRPGVGLLLALLPVAGGMAILCSEADNLLQAVAPAPHWLLEAFASMSQQGLASFFVLVLVAPLTEEFFFRGFVLSGFLKRYRPRKAILLSALLFAGFHLNPYQFISAFALGLIMGWLRWRTGSLWPCLMLHALANGTVFAVGNLLTVQIPGFTPTPDGAHSFQPPWFDLLGLVLALGGLGLLAVAVPRQPAPAAAASG